MKATFITIQKVRTSSQGAYYKNIRWWPGWWDQNDGFGKFSLVDLFESEVKGLVKWQSCLWDDQLSGHCALTVVTVTVMLLRDNWPKCVDRVDYWIIRCWTVWSRQEKKKEFLIMHVLPPIIHRNYLHPHHLSSRLFTPTGSSLPTLTVCFIITRGFSFSRFLS